jgi:hypothetical protein
MEMKKVITLFLIFIVIAGTVFAQSYGLGNTNPSVFTKYRVPETVLGLAQFNSNLTYTSSNNIISGNGAGFYSDQSMFNSAFMYQLTPQYQYLNENDERVFSLNGILDGVYNYQTEKRSDEVNSTNNKQATITLDFSAGYSKYFSPDNLFFNVASKVLVNINEQYNKDETVSPDDIYEGGKSQQYTLRLGIGWGKVRNVTPVVSAIRFQERLKQLSLLNKDLSENTINNLAQQFAKSDYYDIAYVRPEKYFWQGIEETLAKDSVSLKGLNEYGSTYLHEIPNEIRFLRREGFQASINMQLYYDNYYLSTIANAGGISEYLSAQLNANFEYSHQLNLNSQIRTSLSLSGGPNLAESSIINQEFGSTLNIGYDYELTDRFVMSLNNAFSVLFTNKKQSLPQQRIMNNTFSVSFDYFLEDKISLNSTYSLIYLENKYQYMTASNVYNNFKIGITYYFDEGYIFQ